MRLKLLLLALLIHPFSAQGRPSPSPTWVKVLRAIGIATIWLLLALLTLWAVAALYIDVRIPALRIPVTLVYVIGMSTILFKLKGSGWAPAWCLVGFCVCSHGGSP
jgi:small-conductance mechanosensitive channel